MIADSDNLAMRMLAAVWPGVQDTGFQSFLGELEFELPGSCSISMEEGIAGVMTRHRRRPGDGRPLRLL